MSPLTDEAAMSLQQLVDYFNDRFESEHQSNFRPFILENGWVSGIFGPIRVISVFAPVHHAANHEQLIGHIAQISVTPYDSSRRIRSLFVCAGAMLRCFSASAACISSY